MRRKPTVLYCRQTLDAPVLLESAQRWARRNGYAVRQVVIETNEKQPKLRQLLRQSPCVAVIAPDLFHFAPPARFNYFLSLASSLILVREGLVLRRRAPRSSVAFRIAEAVVAAERGARAMHVRESLLLAKLIGRRIGRPSLPDEICDRAVALLADGKSLRAVAQEVGISRSAAGRLRTSMKK